MTSERYLWRESDRTSCKKVGAVDSEMAVRKRLMKAVFFFKAESREVLTGKTPFSPSHAREFRSRNSPGFHDLDDTGKIM